ncbi:MAG: sodium:proton antiporter [Spirochaetaceae bacterium]
MIDVPFGPDFINGQTVSLALFFVGVLGVVTQRNIFKTIIAINIMDVGTILFLLTVNVSPTDIPPVGAEDVSRMVDPLPQALMITAIVIGISVTAVSLTIFISLFRKHGSSDWTKLIHRIESR